MSLAFAVQRLHATGWSPAPGDHVQHAPDGRSYPTIPAVRRAFQQRGLELEVRKVDLFDCFCAEWWSAEDPSSTAGRVVGASPDEAAVYALSLIREPAPAAG